MINKQVAYKLLFSLSAFKHRFLIAIYVYKKMIFCNESREGNLYLRRHGVVINNKNTVRSFVKIVANEGMARRKL
jgi:hypothetical protein